MLLDNFTLLCFSAAVESLRIANRMADETLYEWVLAGEGGTTVSCSAGAEFKLDIDLEELRRDDDVLMVCGGINVQAATTKKSAQLAAARSTPGPEGGGALHRRLYGRQGRAFWTANAPRSTGKTTTASSRNSRRST